MALLLTADEFDVPGSVRWSHPVDTVPLCYEGLGFPLASAEECRDAEHLRGVLPPLSSGARGLYVLDQDLTRPPGRRPQGLLRYLGNRSVLRGPLGGRRDSRRPVLRQPPPAGTAGALLRPGRELRGTTAAVRRRSTPPDRDWRRPPDCPTPDGTQPGRARAERLLWSVLGGRISYAAHARAFVGRLGYTVPDSHEPIVPDLAALFAAHPRALPSLSSTLAPALRRGRAHAPDGRSHPRPCRRTVRTPAARRVRASTGAPPQHLQGAAHPDTQRRPRGPALGGSACAHHADPAYSSHPTGRSEQTKFVTSGPTVACTSIEAFPGES